MASTIPPEIESRLSKDFIDIFNTAPRKFPPPETPILVIRAFLAKNPPPSPEPPAVGRKTDHTIPVPGGTIQLRVYERSSTLQEKKRPVYVNFHGGGWVFGNLSTDEVFCSKVCNAVKCVVVDVDYRLAPEFPWPAQLQDTWAAFLWVLDNADMLGIDKNNVAIGGVSAGGHLAAILAQRCLAMGIPLKLQILTVPALDLHALADDWSIPPDCPYRSHAENQFAPGLNLQFAQFFMTHLLGPTRPHPTPSASPSFLPADVELSPLKADTLTGLPPALITVADVDMLRDEGLLYAERLKKDGVEVKVKKVMGVAHGFVMMEGLKEAADYIHDCYFELNKAFSP